MTDYTAIQEFLTRVMKWKISGTFHLHCGTSLSKMLEEIRGPFFHMYSF